MRNLRIFLISVAALTLLTGFFGLGYHLYQKFRDHPESPMNAIPGNTALIIQLNQAGSLLGELNRSNLIWKSVSRFPGIQTVRNELQYLDSASRKSESISKIFQQNKIWVAISLSGKTNFGALYLAAMPGKSAEAGIVDFVSKLSKAGMVITSSPYSTTTLYRVQAKGTRDPFWFSLMKGVFTGSYHSNLVKRSLDRLSLNTPLAASSGFKIVAATIGQKADANIYVNYRFFSLVLSTITREETFPDLIRLSSFADWSGLDMIIKKDEILLNGVTNASDSSLHFLSLFADQEPQKMKITVVIPAAVKGFTAFAWSNPALFVNKYQARIQNSENPTADQAYISSLADQYSLNINEYFLPWIGNEAAVFHLEDPINHVFNPVMAIAADDSAKALRLIKALGDSIGIRSEEMSYKGATICKSDYPPVFSTLMGDFFNKVKIKNYCYLKGYIIFTEKPEPLQSIIDYNLTGNTIAGDSAFHEFYTDLPDNYNVFNYYNAGSSVPSIRKILKPGISQQLNPVLDSLRKIESVAFHFSNKDGLYLSNFFLRYNPGKEGEAPLAWKASLDTTIQYPPRIIRISERANPVIVTTDISQKIYLISGDGTILWKKPLMGKLTGDIQTLSVPGRDSAFLIFNTDTHLYLLKPDGNYADKFPMRFPMRAVNGITLVKSEDTDQPEFVVAFQDNGIYRFDLDGISVVDWKRPILAEKPVHPATLLTYRGKQILCLVGETGKTLIVTADGNKTIQPNPGYTVSPASGIYLNKTTKKGLLLTTSHDGKIVFIQENGRFTEVTLNLFTPEHRFFYADVTGNGYPEFIFSDRNQIFFYNRNFKLVYSYAFRRDMKNAPFLLNRDNRKSAVGYVVPETNELFLFDEKGYHELDPGIRGSTPFDIGQLQPGKEPSLVVGQGKWIKNYHLSKFQ